MRLRVFTVLVPVAILVAACASSAAAPTWTYAPTPVAAAVPTQPAISSPAAATPPVPNPGLSASASAQPSAVVLDGEVQVVMTDAMRFEPGALTVRAGVPITFLVNNDGVISHEFFVGTMDEQIEHSAEMAAGGMSHGHNNVLRLEAGKSGSLTMTFAEEGTLLVGCHEPGHYEAGMQATLTVAS